MNSLLHKNNLATKLAMLHGKTNHFVQAKLTVNEPGDIYEQEADAMADRVMRMSSTETVKPVTGLIGKSLQRKCAHCEEEEKRKKPVMRKAEAGNSGMSVSSSFASSLNASKGCGSSLPQGARSFMENAFSTDFSSVKIHTGSQASEMSKGIYANAFTTGSDIYFKSGQYRPDTNEGKHLLAHELTHVVQQNSNRFSMGVQRDPVAPLSLQPLTRDERIEYRRQTGNRIDRAFTAFVAAAEQNRAAIKDKARQSASFTEMLIEVVFGLAAPGLAGGIAALAGRLPANASLAAYRIAIAALDTSAVQRIVSASVRIGREYIRRNSSRLFGETELDQYAIVLQSEFQQTAQMIDSNLPNLSDKELLVTYSAYDAQVADVIHYRPIIEDILRRFDQQVLAIRSLRVINVTDPTDRQITIQTGVMWVSHSSGPVLVLATATNGRLNFTHFIDADLKNAALERAAIIQTRGIQTIPWRDPYIFGLPSTIPANVARP